jgi:predicted phage terminase large subunit-like protein
MKNDLQEEFREKNNERTEKLIKEYEERWQLHLALIKQKAVKLFVFNKWVLEAEKGDDGFVPLGKFHRELCNFVQDNKERKKLVLIPRSHLKTKLITIGYATQQIALNPKIRILIYSATWQMAVDIQMTIQKQLQSNMFQQIYGDYVSNASVWAQDRTKLAVNDKREATITAAGIDNNLVGGHYDLIIMDDVVNRDNINTQEQIQKVITRYKDALDLLEPHGQLIVIGTRWHDSDLYGWIMDPANDVKANYDIMIKRAYEGNLQSGEGFEPLWPGKFDRKSLLSRLKEEGWYHFSAQYMNNPVPDEAATFRKDLFQYYDEFDLRGRILNKFLMIDPALTTNNRSDYTGAVVIGVDEWGQWFILDIVRKKLSPNDLINEIFRLRERWNLSDIAIELNAFQKTIAYSLREDSRFKTRPFHITELKVGDRSKEQRIQGLQPLYENHKIFHSKNHPENLYLEDELARFPLGTHDDLIDALSYGLDIVFPAKQQVSTAKTQHKFLY